ncbi:MAG: C40 family peptidase [Bacteroidota bacterium]
MKVYFKYIVFLLIILLASGCASSVRFSSNQTCETPRKDESGNDKILPKNTSEIGKIEQRQETHSSEREKVVKIAQSWTGTPYVWGGNTRDGVDCSGFVKNVYESIGIILPRTAQQQFEFANKISNRELRPGDLLFYRKGNKISHVAIYIGKGEIIHSSSSAKGVIKQPFNDNYLLSIYAGAGRVLN